MHVVGRNLRELRARAGLTREELAERLRVPRRAVEAWESGRSQPDLDTLAVLAGALGADGRELIYGPGRAMGPARRRRGYLLCCAVCAAAALACGGIWGLMGPALLERFHWGYGAGAALTWGAAVSLAAYGCLGCLAPALISVWRDIRILSPRLRRGLLILGCALSAGCVLWALLPWLLNAWDLPDDVYGPLADGFTLLLNAPALRGALASAAGCLLFLGLNRK